MMNKKILEILASCKPGLKLEKLSGNEWLIIDRESSTVDVVKGVRVSNSRFNIAMSCWFTPSVSLPTENEFVFSSYDYITADGNIELMFNKSLFEEEEIVDNLKNALMNFLGISSHIANFETLHEFLVTNPQWLTSSFSKAHFAVIKLAIGETESAMSALQEVHEKLNPHNPITKEVNNLKELIENSKQAEIIVYLDKLKSLNQSKINKLIL